MQEKNRTSKKTEQKKSTNVSFHDIQVIMVDYLPKLFRVGGDKQTKTAKQLNRNCLDLLSRKNVGEFEGLINYFLCLASTINYINETNETLKALYFEKSEEYGMLATARDACPDADILMIQILQEKSRLHPAEQSENNLKKHQLLKKFITKLFCEQKFIYPLTSSIKLAFTEFNDYIAELEKDNDIEMLEKTLIVAEKLFYKEFEKYSFQADIYLNYGKVVEHSHKANKKSFAPICYFISFMLNPEIGLTELLDYFRDSEDPKNKNILATIEEIFVNNKNNLFNESSYQLIMELMEKLERHCRGKITGQTPEAIQMKLAFAFFLINQPGNENYDYAAMERGHAIILSTRKQNQLYNYGKLLEFMKSKQKEAGFKKYMEEKKVAARQIEKEKKKEDTKKKQQERNQQKNKQRRKKKAEANLKEKVNEEVANTDCAHDSKRTLLENTPQQVEEVIKQSTQEAVSHQELPKRPAKNSKPNGMSTIDMFMKNSSIAVKQESKKTKEHTPDKNQESHQELNAVKDKPIDTKETNLQDVADNTLIYQHEEKDREKEIVLEENEFLHADEIESIHEVPPLIENSEFFLMSQVEHLERAHAKEKGEGKEKEKEQPNDQIDSNIELSKKIELKDLHSFILRKIRGSYLYGREVRDRLLNVDLLTTTRKYTSQYTDIVAPMEDRGDSFYVGDVLFEKKYSDKYGITYENSFHRVRICFSTLPSQSLSHHARQQGLTTEALYANASGELFDPTGRAYGDILYKNPQTIKLPPYDLVSIARHPVDLLKLINSYINGFYQSYSAAELSPLAKYLHHSKGRITDQQIYEQMDELFLNGYASLSFKFLCDYKVFSQIFPGIYKVSSLDYNQFVRTHSVLDWLEKRLMDCDERYHVNGPLSCERVYLYFIAARCMNDQLSKQDINETLIEKLMSEFRFPKGLQDAILKYKGPEGETAIEFIQKCVDLYTIELDYNLKCMELQKAAQAKHRVEQQYIRLIQDVKPVDRKRMNRYQIQSRDFESLPRAATQQYVLPLSKEEPSPRARDRKMRAPQNNMLFAPSSNGSNSSTQPTYAQVTIGNHSRLFDENREKKTGPNEGATAERKRNKDF